MACSPFIFGKKVPCGNFEGNGMKVYTYKELKKASNNFNLANKINQGGVGSVYKGVLKDGRLAAIKVLSLEFRLNADKFLREISVISEIQHENLVELYGCCVEGGHRILVYGYLENSSLEHTLLGEGVSNIKFNWQARCRICIGVARGLEFLHDQEQPNNVHRDIRASNIVLDEDLKPKISDFGLANLIRQDVTRLISLCPMAPEDVFMGPLTRKSDVYRFGILLVEIVSGRSDRRILEQTWKLYNRRELVELVDTSLDWGWCLEEACKYLKISLLCTQSSPRLRPTMSSVLKMLIGEMDVDESKITRPGLVSDIP
ncbi:cold-responsive protein kinase 1 [Medicago truncatula]|uniref:non-specific serine/threonine protein kinase n=1 Tax=Medicago truncatula TaxID=3880 RepID=A0A072TQ16_MEDTR|nr:cold-responsive protein kinase 1 [Medicago truncatula]KEH19487.1 receptor-like kinase [Medicago truncatula]